MSQVDQRSRPSAPAEPAHVSEVGRTPVWVHVVKWLLIAAVIAGCLWAAQRAIEAGSWIIVTIAAFIAMSVLVVYSTRRAVPLKYMVPGLILMLLLQIWPIVYTVATAFTNYGDGHTLSKEEAISAIQAQSMRQVEGEAPYGYAVAVPAGQTPTADNLVFLLSRAAGEGAEGDNILDGQELFVGSTSELTPLPAEGVQLSMLGGFTTAPGYDVLKPVPQALAPAVDALRVPIEDGAMVRADTLTKAVVLKPSMSYDEATDTMVNAEGKRYIAQEGNFVPEDGQGADLPAGWTENVGLKNFQTIFTDPTLRGGFLKIFLWTFAFAILSVASTFILGMLLALLFNDPRLKGKGLFRSILILPYAIPAFVTALVWASMFNQEFGLINNVTGLNIDWLGQPWPARAALLITNLWLGFPYMFLICTGALQSIPSDVREAAAVDGASAFRTLRSVIMPLLLVAVGPLLVASFAFNFNNFGIVYLTTGGGPYDPQNSAVGYTDLLITFAYRLALESGQPNIGLASAVSIIIFLIVGAISAVGFNKSKALEEVN